MAEFLLSNNNYTGTATVRSFSMIMDEPTEAGGQNLGPTPVETLLGALCACMAITIKMYAQHKNWETGEIKVQAHLETSKTSKQKVIRKKVWFENHPNLSEQQLNRLILIGNRCPVARMLSSETRIFNDSE